ncbi:inositol monophosphatase [Pseudooceanicola sp. CBS1P-1]|uniref:Inositol monophosphatase n=1 Tax=Pseudooceanicola albus TaxID=2692189 RepID=A0A6L7G2G7_9RHOB|nr:MULTISPECIES: inositol monophosphatase [Pseudooceanicola]MBT9383772.1 inositol monophosphatase [Pseudooceanicola endophyticus]MXN17626.1 inositol monophosphatase [Pseudooceanicola albus]
MMPIPDDAPLKDWLAEARGLARDAGALAMPGFNGSEADRAVRMKGPGDVVTLYDGKVESYLRAALLERHPDHTVLGEEAGGSVGDWAWVLDPIDGTGNFAAGIPFWCISIGLMYRHRPVLGVVYDPNRDEMFSGISGIGAWRDGVPLELERAPEAGRRILGFGVTDKRAPALTFDALQELMQAGFRPRMPGAGALALAWVAAGRYHAYLEANMHLWDVAGAAAVIEGAGGWITTSYDPAQPQKAFAACAGAPGLKRQMDTACHRLL